MSVPTPNPERDSNGVPWCTEEKCAAYDGKRCELTGVRPHGICEPKVAQIVEIAADAGFDAWTGLPLPARGAS